MSQPTPAVIKRSDPACVEIEWTDGTANRFTAAQLRAACPCAQCVDEITGVRRHDPSEVPDDLTQSNLTLVGHYAITMMFADGHHTGIYTFPFLRAIAARARASGAGDRG